MAPRSRRRTPYVHPRRSSTRSWCRRASRASTRSSRAAAQPYSPHSPTHQPNTSPYSPSHPAYEPATPGTGYQGDREDEGEGGGPDAYYQHAADEDNFIDLDDYLGDSPAEVIDLTEEDEDEVDDLADYESWPEEEDEVQYEYVSPLHRQLEPISESEVDYSGPVLPPFKTPTAARKRSSHVSPRGVRRVVLGSPPKAKAKVASPRTTTVLYSPSRQVGLGGEEYEPKSAGRNPPPASPPLSPITRFMRTMRNLASSWLGRSPDLSSAADFIVRVDPEWSAILSAQNPIHFDYAIYNFLQAQGLSALLSYLAQERGEDEEMLRWRFCLRYMDEYSAWEFLEPSTQIQLASAMLQDSLSPEKLGYNYLPNLLGLWDAMFADADKSPDPNVFLYNFQDAEDVYAERIAGFIITHGFTALYRILGSRHGAEPAILFDDLIDNEDDEYEEGEVEHNKTILEPQETAEEIAEQVIQLLQGDWHAVPLTPSEKGRKVKGLPGIAEWRTHEKEDWDGSVASDDFVDPGFEEYSTTLIQSALERRSVRWRRVFQRFQRHIDLYGLELTMRMFINLLDPRLAEELRDEPGRTVNLRGGLALDATHEGQGFRAEDLVAAVLADDFVWRVREARCVPVPRDLGNGWVPPDWEVAPEDALAKENAGLRARLEAVERALEVAKHQHQPRRGSSRSSGSGGDQALEARLATVDDDLEILIQEHEGLRRWLVDSFGRERTPLAVRAPLVRTPQRGKRTTQSPGRRTSSIFKGSGFGEGKAWRPSLTPPESNGKKRKRTDETFAPTPSPPASGGKKRRRNSSVAAALAAEVLVESVKTPPAKKKRITSGKKEGNASGKMSVTPTPEPTTEGRETSGPRRSGRVAARQQEKVVDATNEAENTAAAVGKGRGKGGKKKKKKK
jgi:hypothetical protein